MPTLYQDPRSGNCYKVVLTAAHLGLPLKTVDVDVTSGFTRKPDFLSKNPNGRVPTLEFEDGRILPESNAIAWYLAEGSSLIPADRFARAQMLQWMFFEQYSHEPYIAVARFWMKFVPKEKLREKEHLIPDWHARGNAALAVMEDHLKKNDWFVANQFSLADIALYAYTHCAEDGGFNLKTYPAIGAWLARVASTKNFVKMTPA
ncbi:MAG: glutathione S-transferase family protein [Alphaproteobacteria bacterium]|jgi:glutathione S-transferase|nr:glutathione S-transferase family protein [Alphaproteobacteria bacterium]